MEGQTRRISNIELLKIFSVFIIIISHVIPYNYSSFGEEYINIGIASNSIDSIVFQCFRYLGQIGNLIFIICSIWFLTEKNNINNKKILSIIFDCIFFSLFFLIVFRFLNFEISSKNLIKQFFPLTFSNNWFVLPYILLYLISPYINKVINSLTYNEHKRISIFLIIYNIWNIIYENKYTYNYFITFISLYIIVSFFKKNNFFNSKKNNYKILFSSILVLVGSVLLMNNIGLNIPNLSNKMQYFTNIKNPIVFLISFSIFNIVRLKKVFNNKIVNFVSNKSLIIYIVHDNLLVREYLRPKIFKYIYCKFDYHYIVAYSITLSIITFIISLIIAIIYTTLIKKYALKFIEKRMR